MKRKSNDSVKKAYKPEFINRLDGVVIFRPLDRASLFRVVEREVAKVKARLARKNIEISLDEKAKDYLVTKGFQPENGARPLRRAIEQYLEDPLAEKLLMNPGKPGNWHISADSDKLIFIEQGPAEPAPDPVALNQEGV